MTARIARLLAFVPLVALAAQRQEQPDWLLDPSPYRAEMRQDGDQLVFENGLLRLRVTTRPFALVGIEQLTDDRQLLRAAASFGELTIDGQVVRCGGAVGQPNRAFLLDDWIEQLKRDPLAIDAEPQLRGPDPIEARLAWRRTRRAAPGATWPPPGQHARWLLRGDGFDVTVHVELYDGLPLFAHWLEVTNTGEQPLIIDAFASLRLPIVEAESRVEPARLGVRLPDLHVETDYAFHAMTGADGSSHCVRWLPDPDYDTQVNYEKQTRCLLEVAPEVGPAQTVAPGATFTTFRTFLLAPDGEDRERHALAKRRMYRTLAPWSTENPLMMHVRSAAPDKVIAAIDQCRAVGFEMVILTFGSGFDIEDDSQENLDRWRELAGYAHQKGVQIGGYSLLASRRIEPDADNCIDRDTGEPGGQVFGFAPALASDWGQRYFDKLYRFYEYTGFDLLEHDGSYAGDLDAAARPPLQKGYDDSRWVQYGVVTNFYRWCRARGVYLNVPDWYFLQGSSKTGMGYRETNWSLPRRQQVLHARQNLFDGTRDKNASMGWMFVPLTEYHGGGAAATIEPLEQHVEHYERMLASNLGYGAQACWRGPRLFDGERTQQLVTDYVQWFRKHRTILESDVIHSSSRRADGRDLDWVLHCNPRADEKAMLVVFNPTDEERRRRIPINLYYSGLTDRATAQGVGEPVELQLDRRFYAHIDVTVPAGGWTWFAIR